jgi:hypothetical protein
VQANRIYWECAEIPSILPGIVLFVETDKFPMRAWLYLLSTNKIALAPVSGGKANFR